MLLEFQILELPIVKLPASPIRSAHPPARAGRRLPGGARRAHPALDRRLHRAKFSGRSPCSSSASGLGCSFAVRHRVVLPLQTLSNLLAALRERDFSIRARGAGGARRTTGDDPLGAVMLEVNELAATLHDQRLGALEAGALLRTVMVEIDVAVFTFDGAQLLRLVNRAGERLLGAAGRAAARPHGRRARAARLPRRADAAHRGRRRSPARRAAGRCAARRSGRRAGRTSCSCSPTSAGRCATRSGRRGSG